MSLTDNQIVMELVFFLMVIIIVAITITLVVQVNYILTDNEKICNNLGMEVLYYSNGGIFTSERLTCWNNETKEVKIVK